MRLTSNLKPNLCDQILEMFKEGHSHGKICIKFGISERNYCSILKNYSEKFDPFKEMRLMNQKMKKNAKKNQLVGPIADPAPKQDKITSEERIKILERKLELERKENEQLKGLLDAARDYLGKP